MLMQCQRPSSKIWREQPKDAAEVQGNSAKFKQNLAKKENFVISEVRGSQPMFSKCYLRAAKSHKLTTMVSSKEIRTGNEESSEEFVFSRKFMSENSIERFFAQIQNRMNSEEMLEAIFLVMRAAVKLSPGAKIMEINCFTPKEYFGQTTYSPTNSHWKARECFSKQSNGRHLA